MINNSDLYIVHYDSTPIIITMNKKEAEKYLASAKAKNKYLPYVISKGLIEFYKNVSEYMDYGY